jgi:hypothetical protein
MASVRLLSCLAAAACLSGCALSVHPLCTDDVIVSEPSLVGTWESSKRTLTFTKCENHPREIFYVHGEVFRRKAEGQ